MTDEDDAGMRWLAGFVGRLSAWIQILATLQTIAIVLIAMVLISLAVKP